MKNKGITLISLVITIIILIILASVAIYLGLSNNGIFNRANEAKELTNKQTATEIINLKITTAQMNKYAEKQEMPTLKELSLILGNDNEIEYVTETSKVASTEYDVPSENPTSIYTKLSKYPYEFEINSSLQLASINGVKVANNTQNTLCEWKKYMMNENGYVIGTEEITLPNEFIELIVKVSGGGYAEQYHVIYDALTDGGECIVQGNYNGKMYWHNIRISKSKLNIVDFFVNGTNYKNSAKVEVWYK